MNDSARPATPPATPAAKPSPVRQNAAPTAMGGFSGGWSILLYVLPIPVFVKAVVELFRGNFVAFAVTLGLFVLFVVGASFARSGSKKAAEFKFRKIAHAGGLPYKLLGGIVVSVATFLTGWLSAKYPPVYAVAIGLGALLGYFLLIGFDVRGEKGVAADAGVSAEEVQAGLAAAREKLKAFEVAGKALQGPDLRERLRAIVASAGRVLHLIEEDPRDYRRARKFLNIYLDSAKQVTEQYVATAAKAPSLEMENRFRQVLDEMLATCEEQHKKLLENDVLDLDVQIEVLQTRLKHEGVR